MSASVVASNHSSHANPTTSHTIPLPAGYAAGDRIVVVVQFGGNPAAITWPDVSWVQLASLTTSGGAQSRHQVYYHEVTGSETSPITVVTSGGTSSANVSYLVRGHNQSLPPVVGTATGTAVDAANAPNPPNLVSGLGTVETLWLAAAGGPYADGFTSAPSGYSGLVEDGDSSPTLGCYVGIAWKLATASSENPGTMPLSFYAVDRRWVATTIAVESDVITADFSATPTSGDTPLSVVFIDESTSIATIDTWAWDFGDGATSTSQNPTHIYTAPGTYSVTLTVTDTADETDSLTRSTYITITSGEYTAPEPGGAILEIYAGATGAARWGSAHWGQDVWNSAGWVDVTPQGITVVIRWGSHSPERGVLAEVEAASWLVTTYDPDRLLDPGNEDSPYHTDLVAGLPIRLRHRGTVIRQGYAERIAYFHADTQGAIRATDNVSLMARTPVPADSIVADTLYARARDVIAAAGLHVTVAPDPPSGDPALAPRIEGERSVWRHIADAAEQTLQMAYVDRLGTLQFRPWATPYDRARGVDERNLVDLGTQVDLAGLYSVVQAIDSITETVVERRLTPTPKWGAVTYSRDELTIDAGDWAAAVLADRSLQTVQWIPGMIWPLTADDVEYFATLEAVERLAVDHRDTDPEVNITGIIVGGEIHVTGKRESAALWSFELELAQTAESPLYTDTDPPEFLRNEAGDGYLYAD